MKRFNFMMMLVAVMSLVAVSCTDSNEETPKPPVNNEPMTFDVEVGEVKNSSFTYTVTPSNLEASCLV